MNKLWIIEGLTGKGNAPAGKWVPLWNALDRTSAPTRVDCQKVLDDQAHTCHHLKLHQIYTEFRVTKYVRAG